MILIDRILKNEVELKEKTFRLKNRSKRGEPNLGRPNAQKKRDKNFLTTII